MIIYEITLEFLHIPYCVWDPEAAVHGTSLSFASSRDSGEVNLHNILPLREI